MNESAMISSNAESSVHLPADRSSIVRPWKWIAVLALCSQAAVAQTILNPGFESDAFTVAPGDAASNGGTITGWTLSNPAVIGLNPTGGNSIADNGSIPQGANVAFIQADGVISTTITGLTAGAAYQVSFRANSRSATGRVFSEWSLNDEDYRPFTAYPAVGGSNPYYQVSRSFVATGTTASLGIRNHSLVDASLLVDDFQITAVPRLTVTTADDAGAGSLREAANDAAPAKYIDFDPSLNGSTITLATGELVKGNWQTLAWTGDADSGVNSALTYTHAFNFFDLNYSGDNSPTINGVHFTGVSANDFIEYNGFFAFYKFDLTGADNILYDDSNAIMDQSTGNSRFLASDQLISNNGYTLKLNGLSAGKTYRTSFYCVGHSELASRLFSVTVDRGVTGLDEKAFGYLQGARFVYEFLATDVSQTFVFNKTATSNLGLFGFTNAEIANKPPTHLTIDASALADGITLSGNQDSRFLSVSNGSSLNLDHVSIIDGAPQGNSDGGAVYNIGRLSVRNGLFRNNTAGHYGGAFYNGTGGVLDVDRCRIDANDASFAGGIFNYGAVTMTRSTVSSNVECGIYTSGSLSIDGSTFTGNTTADFGAGIYNTGGLQITNSTFTDNHSGPSGGAIYHDGSSLNLIHCTVAANTAVSGGGGVFSARNCSIYNSIVNWTWC